MGALAISRRAVPLVCLLACGGGGKKQPAPPAEVAKPAPPPETEADRERKRHDAAVAIVPEGSTCLPAVLKGDGGPQLDLAAVKDHAIVCAVDRDTSRLLGPLGCWQVDVSSGELSYMPPTPLPGRNVDVLLDGHCARGFCLPDNAKLPDDKVVHLSWSAPDSASVAMLTQDEVNVFDAASKAQSSTFSIRGDKGVTGQALAVYLDGDQIFIEANGGTTTGVWQYKVDGTPVGPLVGIGADNKPLSTYHGSFSIIDDTHVGVAERGYSSFTSFEVATGKRIKAVRKIGKLACKPDEVESYWQDTGTVSDKCKTSLTAQFTALIGAPALMGKKSLLVMLRGDRLGELSAMDPKLLTEKKVLKMTWCDAANASAGSAAGSAQ
jgi:hypothetical protein